MQCSLADDSNLPRKCIMFSNSNWYIYAMSLATVCLLIYYSRKNVHVCIFMINFDYP